MTSEVFVQVDAHQIRLQRGIWGTIKINGATANLPATLNRGETVVFQHGAYIILKTAFNLVVSYDRMQNLFVGLPPQYMGQTCGLCGNFNRVAHDDFVMPNGSLGTSAFHFATSWKSETSCDDVSPGSYPECLGEQQLIQAKYKCWIIQNPQGPFASCHSEVAPEPYMHDCILDLCISALDRGVLCHSIQNYAAACQRQNVNISAWRNESFCYFQCPEHSHYALCKNPVDKECSADWLQSIRGTTCSEGCSCDDGYYQSVDKCVRLEQCGCKYDGRYYKVGEHIWTLGCAKKCRCDPRGYFRCFSARCKMDQQCILKGGRYGCHSLLTTCVVTGDPHYFTYDGALVHFQGTCDYEVSHTCNSTLDFSFRVVIDNRHFQNPRVSFAYRVEIWFQMRQSSVHVSLERGKAVHVNGRRTQLPVNVGSIARILRVRNMLTVRTKANVEIQFNGASSVFIRVGPEFQNQLCGLCGNFNGDPSDDKLLPSGIKALDDAQFGNAWISNTSSARCKNNTKDLVPCPNQHKYKQMCAILTNSSGPFSECHWLNNPDLYYESCVYDLCQYGSGNRMFCMATEAYDEMCTITGVKVMDWRQATGCSITCPVNQYYDFCGPACPSTCGNPQAPTLCKKACIPGCVCREGYVLNAGVCIPLKLCGCTLNGRYYQLGEQVILGDTCNQRCICVQAAHPMECQGHACKAQEVCKIVDDARGCYPMTFGLMHVYGPSNYITFDGVSFSFQGACKYSLVSYCGPPGKLPSFNIQVLNMHKDSISVSWVKQLELEIYGEKIIVAKGQHGLIKVNGLLTTLPITLAMGKLYAYSTTTFLTIKTDMGLSVSYDWAYHVLVSVPEIYSGSLCGLGGDFNQNRHNDFRTPNGSVVQDPETFGNSWKDSGSQFHCTAVSPLPNCSETELAQYRSLAYCGLIREMDGPFQDCLDHMEAQHYAEHCAKILCTTRGNRKILCEVLATYAQRCQENHFRIQPWGKITGCELTCPKNSRYVFCGSPCPASCPQPSGPPNCLQNVCVEGCQCEAGFVLSGTDCVPWEECGCSYNGRYYLKGETFFVEGENCKKQYRCDGSISAMEADGSFCSLEQFCGTQKGVYGCHPLADGICQISGFLHYTTFDGQPYSFQGTSMYVLVELCPMSKLLPSFRVEVKHEKMPTRLFPEMSMVLVLVNNTRIYLQRGRHGSALVNGIALHLPVHLKSQRIAIYQHGFYIVLTTDFGLTVSYDVAHSLFVTLSPKYQGQVCGMCGNFKRANDGDSSMQTSPIANQPLERASIWSSSVTTGSFVNPIFVKEHLIQSKSMCWIIQNADGPFASCHYLVNPEPYLTNCILDVYASAGNPRILCLSIQTYVAACQRANVTLRPWRIGSFCDPDCPANSHYELCQLPCRGFCAGATIAHLCNPLCAEGCVCDSGYLWSGNKCIPHEQCGCEHKGRYYNVGDLLWLSDCTKRCSCQNSSTFRCVPASCNPGQQCAIHDGKLGCKNQLTTCTISGDPHYFTFDGAVAHFQGSCAYEISRTPNSSLDFSFRVVATNKNFRNPRVSFIYRVDIWLSFKQFSSHLVLEQGKDVKVDGRPVALPAKLEHLANITKRRQMVTVRTHPSLEIQYNGRHALLVRVGPEYWGKLSGMCGNFNGNRDDDKVLPDGKKAKNDAEFGNAWISDISPPKCTNDSGAVATCTNHLELEQKCAILTDQRGPFAECHWHEEADPYYNSCIFDLCQYGQGHDMFCAAVETYEEMCQSLGVQVPSWREGLGCELTCPPNSYYELCGSPCPASCTQPAGPPSCFHNMCVEGCQCEAGFVLSGTDCVPWEECGCSYDGRYYLKGETFFVEGEKCKKKYNCDDSISVIEADGSFCSLEQFCGPWKGVYGCHTLPHGICRVSKFLHYTTFDGQQYNFQGISTYILVELCPTSKFLPSFRVEVKNEKLFNGPLSVLSEVIVSVNNTQIYLQREHQGTVKIDGMIANLPVRIQALGITVYQHGFYTILKTELGLIVNYDPGHNLFVTLSPEYRGQTCGLCGNFNELMEDDFMIRNGSTTEDILDFVLNWISETDLADTGESVAFIPKLEQGEHLTHFKSLCWIIQDPEGPFASCHLQVDPLSFFTDCIFDLYASSGDHIILCYSIQIYVAACQRANITLSPWRREDFCGPDCQTNSHYGLCGVPGQDICLNAWAKLPCLTTCSEGCFCDEGFLRSGDSCIPEEQCGCIYNGLNYKVNQEIVELPHILELTGFIAKIKNMVIVKLAANVEIHYNGQHTLFVKVGPEYQGKLCGMCGNFNGISEDDKVLPDGSKTQNDSHFGNAWKTETSPAGCLDDNSTLEPCENLQEYEEPCGILVSQTGPFAKCYWHVDPSLFYLACLYDLCRYGRHNKMLCTSLAAYEEVCFLEGIQTSGWRASVQCPATDPCLDLACGDDEWCGERGGKWGCFCHKSYSPTKRADYDYQLTCTSGRSSVSLSRCLLFTDGFPAGRLHLADLSCVGSLIGDRLVFYFDTVQKTCGTEMEVNATHAIYTNVVQGHLENTYSGMISRDRFLFLRFSCAFPLNINLSMASVIYPIRDIINMTVSSGQGNYQAIMTLYQDPQYSKPFTQSPIVLTVNNRAYVGIKILGADPTRFVVTLSSCWATPDRDPSSSIRWDLITNQCPNPQDGTVRVEEDGRSLLGHFSFNVFTFIADSEAVYLHCRVRLCNFWLAKCTVNCHSPGSVILGRKPLSAVISAGPFLKYSSNLLDHAL
ncbi:IgGFc-binding protein-like isoform X3 [Erythrolamprus reginae]|uniref:IgGFc-binding protein-like isoform X3 n=1 Tax=Erythrolamprus reginae TaxID=121349 RepID=UPI00396CDF1A